MAHRFDKLRKIIGMSFYSGAMATFGSGWTLYFLGHDSTWMMITTMALILGHVVLDPPKRPVV